MRDYAIACFDKCCPENTKQGVECRKLKSSRTGQEYDFVLVLASNDMIKNAANYPIAEYCIVVCWFHLKNLVLS